MSSENVITLVAAILALFASLIAIYNTNFKRFARERWWERKAKAYEDVVVSLSDLIHYYRTLMDQELQLRSPSKGKMEEIGKRQQEGINIIRRATDMGAFLTYRHSLDSNLQIIKVALNQEYRPPRLVFKI
jgi:hypothetical protein